MVMSPVGGGVSGNQATALNPVELGPRTYTRDHRETAKKNQGKPWMGSAQAAVSATSFPSAEMSGGGASLKPTDDSSARASEEGSAFVRDAGR